MEKTSQLSLTIVLWFFIVLVELRGKGQLGSCQKVFLQENVLKVS